MEQKFTTFNIDELITAYIDNQIQNVETKERIKKLVESDETIRKKYLCELLTKNFLRKKLPLKDPPIVAYQMYEESVQALSENKVSTENNKGLINTSNTGHGFLRQKFADIPSYAYIFGLIVVISLSLIFVVGKQKELNPYIASGTDKNIMVQALRSFHEILKGEVKPQYSSSNAAEVEKYVSENAKFRPHIPYINDYKLIGVSCNEYNGMKLAHLIYKNDHDDVFYIYQTPIKGILSNDLELPEDVHKEIMKDKFYMCDEVDENNCTMTLWFKNDVICASLSKMSKEQMHTTYTKFIK